MGTVNSTPSEPASNVRTDAMEAEATRRLYLTELNQALESAEGRTRRRIFCTMDRAVREHCGEERLCPDEQVLAWSHLPLGHQNIIAYHNRPFVNVDDMNAALWNEMVPWSTLTSPVGIQIVDFRQRPLKDDAEIRTMGADCPVRAFGQLSSYVRRAPPPTSTESAPPRVGGEHIGDNARSLPGDSSAK